MDENIKELIKKIHQNAVDKGFWEEDKKLMDAVSNYVQVGVLDEKSRIHLHNLVVMNKIGLIMSELGESVEAMRKNRFADLCGFDDTYNFEHYIKDTFEDEIADVIIRLFDLAGYLNLDLELHIKEKMIYNSTREKLHGKAF